MKQVIMIPSLEEVKEEKPVEFTHYLSELSGWELLPSKIDFSFDKIVYLGKCNDDGDMFAAYCHKAILIYRGNLNSGKY